jgi:putative FmdB family regulatory protein
MPTYEYACKSCGEHLEVVQSFKDEPLTECPNCGGNLRKVFGSIGIAFKGSGFYKTDSRSGSKSGKHKEPVKASADSSSSDKSSSDKSSTEKKSSGDSTSPSTSSTKASETKAAS